MDECLHTSLRLYFWVLHMNTPLPSHSIFIRQALKFVKSVMLKHHLFADASSIDIRYSNTFKHFKCHQVFKSVQILGANCVFSIISVQNHVGACEMNLCPHFLYLEARFVWRWRDIPVSWH